MKFYYCHPILPCKTTISDLQLSMTMNTRDRLSISPNAPLTKNDRILVELYKEGKWKQALSHCEKRQKKGEKGDFFVVGHDFFYFGQSSSYGKTGCCAIPYSCYRTSGPRSTFLFPSSNFSPTRTCDSSYSSLSAPSCCHKRVQNSTVSCQDIDYYPLQTFTNADRDEDTLSLVY